VLKPTPKPKQTAMASLYEATESLMMSVQRSFSTGKDNNNKVKKYARGLFY